MGATNTSTDNPTRVNRSMISIKVVTFFVISGLTALHVLHSSIPQILGLNFDEYRFINILAPFISILGPLIAGPLADKLAAKNPTTFGRSLRILTAVFLLLTAITYSAMFFVPSVHREEARRPLVSFGCDANGAVVFQERCSEEATCHHWAGKSGSVVLTNCSYTCQNPSQFESLYRPWMKGSPSPPTETSSESDYRDYEEVGGHDTTHSLRKKRHEPESASAEVSSRDKRQIAVPHKVYVEPPHLCVKGTNEDGTDRIEKCHVYTEDTDTITVHSILRAATNVENDTHSADWCNYPLDGFSCNVPEMQVKWMIAYKNNTKCKPMVECEVLEPYDSPGSVLANSQCIRIEGDLDATLGGYYTIRVIGDVLSLAVLTLLNSAIVVAVRETSEGRGEVCRQYIFGAIGYVLLFSPLDVFYFAKDSEEEGKLVALIVVIVCFVLAAIVLLLSTNMPLSPPEWWWHTKSGMVVYPMSAIRKYGPEMFALALVAVTLGTLWSSIHSYLRWTFTDPYAVTFTGLLLVFSLLFNVDRFIEYCAHSNILIGGFAMFIIRFTALTDVHLGWLTVVMEVIEPLVIGLVWISIILYMRHIMPRRFTATGQAIAIIAFFCLGKGFGALIGLTIYPKEPHALQSMYQWLAIATCIITIVYFIIYNLILAPRFAAKSQPQPPQSSHHEEPTATNGAAALNGQSNGNSYSPLRIYHNERGKKGQFRY